jgi:hypothetical protein
MSRIDDSWKQAGIADVPQAAAGVPVQAGREQAAPIAAVTR